MDKLVHKRGTPATALASRENGRKSRGPVTDQRLDVVGVCEYEEWEILQC